MRGCSYLLVLTLVLAAPIPAPAAVVPKAQTNAEGNSDNALPFNCSAIPVAGQRYQQVYLGSEVGSGLLTAIAFRQDGAAVAFGPTTITGITIRLSSASVGPDALSTTFANNIGPDVETVFSGNLTISSQGNAAVPRPFDIVIPLQRPFLFDANAGKNLLLDVTSPLCFVTTQFDAQSMAGDSVSRVFTGVGTPSTSSSGTADTLGLVTFFVVVPSLATVPALSTVG